MFLYEVHVKGQMILRSHDGRMWLGYLRFQRSRNSWFKYSIGFHHGRIVIRAHQQTDII